MNTKPLQSSTDAGHGPDAGRAPGPYRLAWACLPVMLALSGAVLILFGVSWWTALTVVLLLACPAAMATAAYIGFQPFPDVPGLRREQRKPGQ
ncbi:MAG: hypothetical protein EOR35_29450 [Mesorhizobium sp.]|nr:MAG: hypothetical protein EOR35_29450 [Mesorhizobium sp.]